MTKRRTPAPVGATKRCAVYTRKSSARGLEQEFNSLDAQRDTCEQYIRAQAHQGWQLLPEEYDDGGFSGKNTDRPAFQRLMTDVDAGKIDIVIVYKIDRLSRSLLDFAELMRRFEKAGASFVAVTQNFSTADAIGRLTLNLLMSFAEFEREMISERTKDKIAATRRRGQWTGGPAPFGYRLVDKKLVIEPSEAALVREVFALYTEHRSSLFVAEHLNAREMGGRRWSATAVLNALRNPAYVGLIAHGEERFQGQHQGIVDRAQFDRAQALLEASPPVPRGGPRSSSHLLSGLLRCACCGAAMTSASTRKRGREYRYYRCTTRDKFGSKACAARPLPAAEIERFVVDRVREATADGRLATEVAARLRPRLETRRAALVAERAELPRRIGQLSMATKAIVERLLDAGGEQRHALEERLVEARGEIDAAERRLVEVLATLAALDATQAEADWVTSVLREFDPIWAALTPINRARLVRALVASVEIDGPSGAVTARLRELDAMDVAVEGATG